VELGLLKSAQHVGEIGIRDAFVLGFETFHKIL
jgi:hypothetical protein